MADDTPLNATAQGQLKSVVERVERLEVEKAEIAGFIKEVFAEAKGNGFDVKILRKVIRLRKQDRAKRQEEEALTDLYLSALGELPLFESRSADRGGPDAGLDATRMTISTPSGLEVETTLGDMKRAAKAVAADKLSTDGLAAIVHARTHGGAVPLRGAHAKGAREAIRKGYAEEVDDVAELNLRGQDTADAALPTATGADA